MINYNFFQEKSYFLLKKIQIWIYHPNITSAKLISRIDLQYIFYLHCNDLKIKTHLLNLSNIVLRIINFHRITGKNKSLHHFEELVYNS